MKHPFSSSELFNAFSYERNLARDNKTIGIVNAKFFGKEYSPNPSMNSMKESQSMVESQSNRDNNNSNLIGNDKKD